METDRAGEGPVYCKPVHCLTHEPSSGMSAIWTTSTSAGRSLTLLGFSTGRWKKETPSRCRWVRPPYSLKLLLLSAFTHASIRPRRECLSLVRSIRHTHPPHPSAPRGSHQSITALAHLRAACLYIVDVSEQCGYTIAQQSALFHSIKPLFSNKPILVICNKIDSRRMEDLTEAEKALIEEMVSEAKRISSGGTMTSLAEVEN